MKKLFCLLFLSALVCNAQDSFAAKHKKKHEKATKSDTAPASSDMKPAAADMKPAEMPADPHSAM